MFEFLIITIVVFISICLATLLFANDFSLPELDLFKYQQPGKPLTVVAIFPHPDDETMAAGGTLAKFGDMPNTRIVLITATRGEQGETGGKCAKSDLANVREQELRTAANILNVDEVIIWQFPDGGLDGVIAELERKLESELQQLAPDVIISYDSSGLYGHPDHIVLSQSVQKIHNKLQQGKLLFATLPARVLKNIKLPDSITLEDRVIELDKSTLQHTLPNYRVTFWRYGTNKITALSAHATQNIAKHLPVPLFIYRLIGWTEYYSEA